jgi:hypothetical protein
MEMAKGRFSSTRSAKAKGKRALPPRRTGSSKVMPNGRNPMAHGGNC